MVTEHKGAHEHHKTPSSHVSEKKKSKPKGPSQEKEKHILPPPAGLKKSKDGKSITIDLDEIYDPRLRRSFRESAQLDKNREYGASYDFEDHRLKNIDFSAGKTDTETSDHRASVHIRVDEDDEFYVHNHPSHNYSNPIYQYEVDHWNRPSGQDLYSFAYERINLRYFKTRSAYIVQPDGRFIRYSIVDTYKATEQMRRDIYAWDNLAYGEGQNELMKQGYKNGVDYAIESKYQEILQEEINDSKVKSWIKDRPNANYIASDKKRAKLVPRRAFNRWTKWLLENYGISVRRMDKNYRWRMA